MNDGDAELAFLWRLVSPAAPAVDVRDLDWSRVLELLARHRMQARAFERLRAWNVWDSVPPVQARELARFARAAEIKCDLQWRDLLELRDAYQRAALPFVVLKGIGYRWRLYEKPSSRPSRDVDILIRRQEIPAVKRLMFECGFRQSAWLPTNRFVPAAEDVIASTEARHYELAQFVRRWRLRDVPDEDLAVIDASEDFFFYRDGDQRYSYSVIDVHWNLDPFWNCEEVYAATHPEEINGVIFNVLDPEVELVYAMTKVYFESFDQYGEGLGQFEDAARLVARRGPAADWSRVRELAERHQYAAACWYVLSHVADAGVELPAGARELLDVWRRGDPDVEPIKLRDHGDFLPFLLGRRYAVAAPR